MIKRRAAFLLALMTIAVGLSGCAAGGTTVTPNPAPSSSAYPKYGHAPDYSWIAGQVAVTRIQGGCTYIMTTQPPTPGPTQPEPGVGAVGTPVVSTAVSSGTSPPLRDITPQVAPSTTPSNPGDRFVPGGAWNPSQFKDGDFVVAFGHVAGPGEPSQVCPGGTTYIIERAQANP